MFFNKKSFVFLSAFKLTCGLAWYQYSKIIDRKTNLFAQSKQNKACLCKSKKKYREHNSHKYDPFCLPIYDNEHVVNFFETPR